MILKDLSVQDADGNTHYYEVSTRELARYNACNNLFDWTEGKELPYECMNGSMPIDTPDGFYNVMTSGMHSILKIRDNTIVGKATWGSQEMSLFSHIERYYEEEKQKQQAAQSTQQDQQEPPDTAGIMRIEGAEIY